MTTLNDRGNDSMNDTAGPASAEDLLGGQYATLVLLVDDQVMVGEAIRRALASAEDVNFHYCGDPAMAIQLAERIRPTVILQDLVMPGVDGLALVRLYRSNPATRHTPVIVLSTKEEATVKSAAFAAGANDYLVKLPDSIELVARIRYHSRAYLNLLQRDAAFQALRKSQQEHVELSRLINVDGLTGLNNRRYFDEFADIEWKRAIRDGTELGLLMIDVDDFKRYNDTYGHLAGDEVLRSVGRAMRNCAERPADIVARFGGEEFVALLPGVSAVGVQRFGEKLLQRIEELAIPHAGSTVGGRVTASIGSVSTIPRLHESVLAAIASADAALYDAKRSGKNRVAIRRLPRDEL